MLNKQNYITTSKTPSANYYEQMQQYGLTKYVKLNRSNRTIYTSRSMAGGNRTRELQTRPSNTGLIKKSSFSTAGSNTSTGSCTTYT
jgi:hypothetical protein